MRSTFYGLEIARKGLFVSQKALDVTGHNIANVNTPGYSRQRIMTRAVEPGIGGGLFSTMGKGQVGGGVDIQSIDQIRNSFIDMQLRRENKQLGKWSMKTSALQYVEDLFKEPSDAGLNAALGELFNSMQEMSKQPESKEIRTLVRQDAIKLTETLKHYHSQLIQLQREQDTGVRIGLLEINDIIAQVRDINEQIFRFEAGGEKANDLRDSRNILVDRLSQIINIDYYETPNGRFRIDIHGMSLVDHTQVKFLETRPTMVNPVNEGLLQEVYWKDSNMKVSITAGEIKGLLEIRDGISPDSMGLPYFVNKLNIVAEALVKAFNDLHSLGYTLPYEGIPSQTGINFFDPTKITAKDISLSQDIMDSVFNIACSGQEVPEGDPSKWGDNTNINEIISLRTNKMVGIINNSFEDFMKELIAELAVETSHSAKMMNNQVILTDNLENQRMSISGVSIDEEMTMMVRYQHSYNAAARMITAMDEALDILINRTGLVGR